MEYKVCPTCKHHCEPNERRCPKCGNRDIPFVPITDDANNEASKAEPHKQPAREESAESVRICDNCGTKNEPNARRCKNPDCEDDISDVTPAPSRASAGIYELAGIDGKLKFDIVKPSYIIGRENDFAEYLSSKPYVSRKHAEITISENRVYLKDIGSANHTYINNKLIEKDKPVLLEENAEIGLGGNKNNGSYQEKAAYFIFRKKC